MKVRVNRFQFKIVETTVAKGGVPMLNRATYLKKNTRLLYDFTRAEFFDEIGRHYTVVVWEKPIGIISLR